MGERSAIEWTDATWNPIRGCEKVSPGCKNCYALTMALRFNKPGQPYHGFAADGDWTGKMAAVPEHLADPIRWKKPRRIFVNSMSDLFHEALADEVRDAVLAVMLLTPRHTFQVLTKRADKMRDYFRGRDLYARVLRQVDNARGYWLAGAFGSVEDLGVVGIADPTKTIPAHMGFGVSLESQLYEERVKALLETPTGFRFLSCEPLLGPIDLENVGRLGRGDEVNALTGWRTSYGYKPRDASECAINVQVEQGPRIDWVIAGGESGGEARPMDPGWARSLRDQCERAGVPFFFKQWGEWAPSPGLDGRTAKRPRSVGETLMERVGKKAAGAVLDGREHRAFPERGP